MKKILLLCVVVTFRLSLFAQTQTTPFPRSVDEPQFYLGISTGLNNMAGLFGTQIEIVASKNILVGAGFGLSSWGTKWALDLQYYPSGWYKLYMKGGFSRNSGLENFDVEMELQNGNSQNVLMNLNPVNNAFFTTGYAWKVGNRNKFFMEIGYALPLVTKDYYTLIDPVELSSMSKDVLQVLRPGGLVVALGINFGFDL